MIGEHTVTAYPDRAAAQWVPLGSNHYFDSSIAGWKATPFGSAWVWSAPGQIVSTNPAAAYQALGRDPAFPIDRPLGDSEGTYRLRLVITVPDADTKVQLFLRFGLTAASAFEDPTPGDTESDAAYWFTFVDAGRHTIEVTLSPSGIDPAFVFLSPQVTLDQTTAPVTLDSLELHYRSGEDPVDLTCLIDEVSIVHGRDDTTSQPTAPAATIDLTVTPDAPLPSVVDIGAVVVISTATPTGSWVRFTGRITDVALAWDDAGAETPDSGVGQIVAVGVLADLARRIVGEEPWPVELDGARVARVAALAGEALNPQWSDPGTVQLIPRDVDRKAALPVMHGAAESAGGVVWQTRTGEVRYADADHRRGVSSSLLLDACDVLVTPTWVRNLDGLVNDVSIGYGVPPEGGGDQPRYTATDATSITRYGRYELSATTELNALADATAMGLLALTRNNAPVWVLGALPVDVKGLSDEDTDALLGLDMHALIQLTGMPAIGSAPTTASLWVEGWRERLAWGVHEVELAVSGYCRTSPPPRWDDLSPARTWDSTDLSLTWDAATCLGPSIDTGRWADVAASFRWDDAGLVQWDQWTTTPTGV